MHMDGCGSYDLFSFKRNFDDIQQEVTLRLGKYEKSNVDIDNMDYSITAKMVSNKWFWKRLSPHF